MRTEHRGPLAAFVALALACGVFLTYSLNMQSLVPVTDGGGESAAGSEDRRIEVAIVAPPRFQQGQSSLGTPSEGSADPDRSLPAPDPVAGDDGSGTPDRAPAVSLPASTTDDRGVRSDPGQSGGRSSAGEGAVTPQDSTDPGQQTPPDQPLGPPAPPGLDNWGQINLPLPPILELEITLDLPEQADDHAAKQPGTKQLADKKKPVAKKPVVKKPGPKKHAGKKRPAKHHR